MRTNIRIRNNIMELGKIKMARANVMYRREIFVLLHLQFGFSIGIF